MPHRRCLHRRFGSLCHPDRAPFATLPRPILFSWPFSLTVQTVFGRHPEERSDEGSLFVSYFLPGRKPRASHPPFFIFRSPPKSPPTAQSTHQSSPSSTPQYPTPKSAPPTDTPPHSQTAPPSSPP